ncbi:hypothetical protein J14TS2_28920 [Bacillus sp. J14TS2]|uniref:hypothetical protein n=1 Tax=Bacillus sp. J14TS2 TaxID=2807188 RepID=UPI001B18C1ED|nr:hypothetical protein [Bacillus sp. J14TS2]GIN72417.1 hypothetical protein J14TS2_28920 [Bacillus sp. J14TS2]
MLKYNTDDLMLNRDQGGLTWQGLWNIFIRRSRMPRKYNATCCGYSTAVLQDKAGGDHTQHPEFAVA